MNSDQLRQLVQSYNPPPAKIPRDEMWTRIRLARDFNSPRIAAPRETMWQRLMLLRQSATLPQFRRRGTLAGARIAGRDIRIPTDTRGRGGWIFVSLASFAAVALFAIMQTRGVPAANEHSPDAAVAQSTFGIPMPSALAFESEGLTRYASSFAGRWSAISIDDPISEAYKRASITHLKRSDALIAGFRSLSNDDVINRNMRTTVRELLSNTRLLLNSPAPNQAQYRSVFLDLEMVLVKMTLLTPSTIVADRQAIETTVERRKLVARMRDLIPTSSGSNAN